jgi:hypothetical protein
MKPCCKLSGVVDTSGTTYCNALLDSEKHVSLGTQLLYYYLLGACWYN